MTFTQRILILIGVFAAVLALIFVTRPTLSLAASGPLGLAYRTGAHAAAPVIYKFTVNDRTLFSPAVADFGAATVPPVGSGTIATSVPRLAFPNDTILDIKLEWTEVWTGRQYAVQTQLDEENFPWFESGLRLNMTFEQNGRFTIRILSEKRWKEAMALTSSGPLTLADYVVAFEACAPLLDGLPLSAADIEKILSEIWAVDMEWLQTSRNKPLPTARCAGSED